MTTWKEFAALYNTVSPPLISDALLARRGSQTWNPDPADRTAAGKLHAEMVSRITTQPLNYRDGVEVTALTSVYSLFKTTREIVDKNSAATTFEAVAWDVLNTIVRPFTAKWHRKSEEGALSALDSTDEFRAELVKLQAVLRRFDAMLEDIRDGAVSGVVTPVAAPPPGAATPEVPWGIPPKMGNVSEDDAGKINAAELLAIRARRMQYTGSSGPPYAIGLALSGGGIRSATFGLGVLVALARRGVLSQIDYLSTVSGGGYLGTFLSAFLASPKRDGVSLRSDDLPFHRKEGEAAALRHVRHHSRYLAMGRPWEQLALVLAQLFGMVLNGLGVVYIAALLAAAEALVRPLGADSWYRIAVWTALALLAAGALVALGLYRRSRSWRDRADYFVAAPACLLMAVLVWHGLGVAHGWTDAVMTSQWSLLSLGHKGWLVILGGIPLVSSATISAASKVLKYAGRVLAIVATVSAPLFFFGVYLVLYQQITTTTWPWYAVAAALVGLGIVYFWLIDINATSPHRMYRNKLAKAYIVQAPAPPPAAPASTETPAEPPLTEAVPIKLSALANSDRAPYHLMNAALNVPGTDNSAMQGRQTDFFLFSARFCGSPITGYRPTTEWEELDPQLDLAAAMAISGAAAAPQAGLATIKRARFWLAMLNVRLDYWVANPAARRPRGAPGLNYLVRQMTGAMHERLPRLNVSDGGHLENLGIYELLRRRCKYIIAIDGEEDPRMTFGGFTTLQRMAEIDLGVKIEVDLGDMRLNDHGLSRSHFKLCRITYPADSSDFPKGTGYLLYTKLSLTGNEGEFLRRYRLDEPAFPHHPTTDQSFSEAQFEAYRALGEHIGDKLFLRPIVGDDIADGTSVDVAEWFRRLERELLPAV